MNNEIYRKATAAGVLIAVLIMIAASLPLPVFAGENVPVAIDIGVTYIVDGNDKTAGGDRFSLTADDPGNPMPDGSIAGRKTIDIQNEGSYSFGDIIYEKPDVYWYTITRETTEKKGVVKDEQIYKAKVIALNDGHGYVLTYRKGSNEKTELIYTDRVAPETGDHNIFKLYSFIALAAASAITAIFATGKWHSKKEVLNETEEQCR